MTAAARALPGPYAARLPGGRLHLSDGPIDLVLWAEGPERAVARAYERATARFDGLLAALVAELAVLKQPVGGAMPVLRGPVARRMAAAAWPHRAVFVTPMAAVAGAVAEEVLAAMTEEPGLARAFVNDGGDIAIHLAPGHAMRIGVVPSLARAVPEGVAAIDHAMPVRGIATSGRHGRSFSLGIADAVTVLAATAAAADVAATLIANAVNLDHPAIARKPARAIDPDSDLGDLPVTVGVGALDDTAIQAALDRGAACAEGMRRNGLIDGALLALANRFRVVGSPANLLPLAGHASTMSAGERWGEAP